MATMTDGEKILNFFRKEYPEICLTHDKLKHPKFELVLEVYQRLTSSIFGLHDSLFSPNENEPQLPIQIVLRLMQSIINDTTEENFVITDLIMPTANRTRFFLLNLIDFYNFINQHIKEIDECLDEVVVLKLKLDDDRAAIAKLGDEIQKQNQKNERSKRKRLDLSSKFNQLEIELATKQKEKEQIKENVNLVEDQMKKKEAKISSLDASIDEALQEAQQLEMDIVSSPHRMFSEIQRTESELTQCEENIEDHKRQAREYARQKAGSEELSNQVEEFEKETKTSFAAKMKLFNEQRIASKESDAHLQARQQSVLMAERKLMDRKAEGEEALRKQKADGIFLKETIECVERKIQQIKDEIVEINQLYESKDKRELLYNLKQKKQILKEMEEEHLVKQNNVNQIVDKLRNVVATQQKQIQHNTEVFNRTISSIQNNEKFAQINQLLAQNEELINKKRELEEPQ